MRIEIVHYAESKRMACRMGPIGETTTIEEELVALAPKVPQEDLLPYVLVVLGVSVVLLALMAYIMVCQKYRIRIRQLSSDGCRGKVRRGWNYCRLRKQVDDLERETAENVFPL